MFENTRHRFHRPPETQPQPAHGVRGRFMTRKHDDHERPSVAREPQYSPVHGRHCICDSCLRLRQS